MSDGVTLTISGNAKPLDTALAAAEAKMRGWGGKAEAVVAAASKRMGAAMQGIGGQLTGFLSGQMGAIGGALSIGGMVAAAGENAAAQKKLDAVLKATGNSTGLARSQMDDLAKSLAKTTNNSVATNKEAMALLATFTGIRGDQFKGTLTAAEDLAAVFGTDVTNSVRMVGKAVNDPLEGVNRLKEVGISFTDEQQKQIRNYFAMGQAAKAQQVILDELNKRMGGAAKNTASPTTKAINEMKEAGAELGESVLPGLAWSMTKVAGFFSSVAKGVALVGQDIGKAFYGMSDGQLAAEDQAAQRQEAIDAKRQARAARIADMERQRSEIDSALPKSFSQQLRSDLESLDNMLLKLHAIKAESGKAESGRERLVNQAIDKVLESKESGLGLGNDVDSQIRQYGEKIRQYDNLLNERMNRGTYKGDDKVLEEGKTLKRSLTGDLRAPAEKFAQAWDDLAKKLARVNEPAKSSQRALRDLVDSTIGADPDKFSKYGEEFDNLNSIMAKAGTSAEEQARRRKALHEAMFGPAVLTNLQRYRKELDEIARMEKAGLGSGEAAARRKASGESLTGADILTAAEKYRKANEVIDERARTDPNFFGSGQLMRQTKAAREQYQQESGVKSVLDSIKTPEQQLGEQLKKLADMRLGREGFLPGSLSEDQYHTAVNKAVESSPAGSFRASFVGGQDMWKNMAQNGMSQNGGQVFEETKKQTEQLIKVAEGIVTLVEVSRASKKRGVVSD
jgi:hypothetical protein